MCQTRQKTEPPNYTIQSSILSASPMSLAPALPQGLLRDDILSSSYLSVSSLTGICYSSSECSGLSNGYADGRCAQGFGVCCVIRSRVKSSIFVTWSYLCSHQVHRVQRQDLSELYPHPEPGLPRHLHRHHRLRVHPRQGQHRHLPVQAGLCQLRDHGTWCQQLALHRVFWWQGEGGGEVAYKVVNMRCSQMTITTPSATAPPTICGYNTGHHIYIDSSRGSLTSNPIIAMTFTGWY